jgi:photosystem II stability/assembly factor-like uncharacterized protein
MIACAAAPAIELPYAATLNANTARYRFLGYYGSLYRLRALPDQRLIALESTGMFVRGKVGGSSWARGWTTDVGGNDFAISDDGQALWLIGNRGQLRYSADAGEHWESLETGTTADLLAIEMSKDGNTLWAAGKSGTLIRSIDRGKHWEPINSGTTEDAIYGIYLAPDGHSIIVVGDSGFIASGDTRGRALTLQQQCSFQTLRRIAASPDGTKVVAVGADGAICYSSNSGRNWNLNRLPDDNQDDLWAVAFDPKRANFIVVGENGYVYRLDSSEWEMLYLDWLSDNLYNIVVASKDQRLVAAGAGGVIISSSDSGKTWVSIDDKRRPNSAFTDIATSWDGIIIVAVESDGTISFSQDAGKHFATSTLQGNRLTAVAVAAGGQVAYVGTSLGDLYRWSPGQADWQRTSTKVHGSISAMRTNRDGTVLVATTRDGAIWKRTNNAGDAQRIYSPQPGIGLYAIAVDQSGDRFLAGGSQGRTLVSDNGGTSWTASDLSSKASVLSVAWDNDGALWAGNAEGGIFAATKAGAPWVYKDTGAGAIRGLDTFDGMLWWTTASTLQTSYDRLLSHVNVRTFVGNINGLYAAPGAHTVWIATNAHELGMVTRAEESFPRLLKYDVPRVLSTAQKNRVKFTFSKSTLCAASQIKLAGFISAGGARRDLSPMNYSLVAADTFEASFELPSDLPNTDLTLRIGVSCLDFYYMYSFPDRALASLVDRIPGGYWTIAGAAAALLLPLASLILYGLRPVSLLRWQQVLKSDYIPPAIRPVAGIISHYLLAEFLCKRPRVLAAWVAQHRQSYREKWDRHPLVSASRVYLSLPLQLTVDNGRPESIDQPGGSVLTPYFTHIPLRVQIIGSAGIGKTTLACTLGQWLLDGSLLGRCALPILVGGGPNAKAQQVFEQFLPQMFGSHAPCPDLVSNLLAIGYLVPIVDRLSERQAKFKESVEVWSPSVGLLITTSREEMSFPYRTLAVHPMPISSISVLSRYIENEIKKRKDDGAIDPMRDTADIVSMLVHSIASSPSPQVDAPLVQQITPLLASTFASLAFEMIADGESLALLPLSTAQVYLAYVRRLVNTASLGGPLMAACNELGHLSVRNGNGPGHIDIDIALQALDRLLGADNGLKLIDHLVSVGILRKTERIGGKRIAFLIDSFAEVLAANFIVENESVGSRLELALQERIDKAPVAPPSALQTLDYVVQLRFLAVRSTPVSDL